MVSSAVPVVHINVGNVPVGLVPSEQMYDLPTVVVPSVMFAASFLAAVWIPVVSAAAVKLDAP